MKRRQFDKLLEKIATRKRLDVSKIHILTDEEREGMVHYIVRNRGPIVKELIPDGFDMDWLNCMGYLYRTVGKDYNWVHTGEHTIK